MTKLTILACLLLVLVVKLDASTTWALAGTSSKLAVAAAMAMALLLAAPRKAVAARR